MSRIRYEQAVGVAPSIHKHDGTDAPRIQYDKGLINQPRNISNVRHTKVNLIGRCGTIDYLEHGCGYYPIVKCYVGGKETKIKIEVINGNIRWETNNEFSTVDNAILVIMGRSIEYVVDDSTPEVRLDNYWCGYEWNVNDSDPSVTRITGEGMEDYFLRDGGGILKGTLFEYVAVDPNTKKEVIVPIDDAVEYENYRYGQHGDLFAKMKGQLYYKVERDGDIRRKKLSRYPLSGFKPYHANDYIVYIGLYEASCNNERTKIYSRVTPIAEYDTHLGGSYSTATSGEYDINKFHNTPNISLSTTQFSNLTHSKGDGYDIMDYMTWLMLSDLFMAEFGTRNSQLPIQGADSNGYSRGGLGNGCTNVSNWEAYNNYNPVAELGCTDGHGSGCGQSLVPACNSLGLTPANNVYANRFYGIENPFGHLFKLLTGIHIITKVNDTDDGFESYKTFICDDPSKFMNETNRDNGTDDIDVQFEAGYDYEGEKCHTNGYIKDVIFGDYGSIIPSAVGGGSSTYYTDYNYSTVDGGNVSSQRWSLFGGSSYDDSKAGLFKVSSYREWSSSSQRHGARLCYYKQNLEETYFYCEDCSGEDNTIIIKKSAEESPDVHVEYSYDTVNWKELKTPTVEGSEIYLPANKKVYLRGNNMSWGKAGNSTHVFNNIDCDNYFNVGGNIGSLLFADDMTSQQLIKGSRLFYGLFYNSENIINAKNLVLSTLNTHVNYEYAFCQMFYNCHNLKSIPKLDVKQISVSTFELFATNCFNNESHIEILNTDVLDLCYSFAFTSSYKITSVYIKSITYSSRSFMEAFNRCSNLSEVKCHFQHYDNSNNQFTYWLANVAPNGTFWLPYDSVFADEAPRNGSGIPAGWTIRYFDPETGLERERVTEEELKETYFYCEDISGEADNEVVIHKTGTNGISKLNLEYSHNQKIWTALDMPDVDEVYDVNIPFNGHRRIYLRGENLNSPAWGINFTHYICCSKNYVIGGNPLCLFYGENYIYKSIIPNNSGFYSRFGHYSFNNHKLIYSHNLALKHIDTNNTLGYHIAFQKCGKLITAPKYIDFMENNYDVPYVDNYGMFSGCSSLLKSPEIMLLSIHNSSTTYSLKMMFDTCTKLKNIKVHFKTVDIDPSIAYGEEHPFYRFCEGVARTGDFWMPYDATWNPEEYRGIIVPQNWTIRYFNTITGDEVFPESNLVE